MINEHNLNIGDKIWIVLGNFIYHCTVKDKYIGDNGIRYELDNAMGLFSKDYMYYTKLEALESLYKMNRNIDIDAIPPYWD